MQSPRFIRFVCASVIIIGLVLPPLTAQAEVSVIDGAGREVRLQEPARRIISLAPHATELLFAAGAGDAIVGTVDYSDYPPAVKTIPKVGGYSGLDLEAILALEPDLVIAWQSGNPRRQIERLQQLGLALYYSEPRQLEDIPLDMERLGRLAGTEVVAGEAARKWRKELAVLRMQYGGRTTVSMFYQVWQRPLMTINGEHLISKVMALCGARNVFAELTGLAPQIDIEAVLVADPEVILTSAVAGAPSEKLDAWRKWPQLQAVKNDQLFYVPPDVLQRAGPRILEGARHLCQIVAEVRKKH